MGLSWLFPRRRSGRISVWPRRAARVWRKHGALDYVEAVGNDLGSKWAGIKFPRTVKAKPSETVVFSYIVFKDRKHRDIVNAKVMKDPLMKDAQPEQMPFDMKRMVYGGFKVLVEA